MAMASPRMAAPDSFQSHPPATNHPMLENSLLHVVTTSGRESTARREKRRNQVLIYQNWKYSYLSQ